MISAWWIVLAASLSGMVGFLIGAVCSVASEADDAIEGEDHSRVRYDGR